MVQAEEGVAACRQETGSGQAAACLQKECHGQSPHQQFRLAGGECGSACSNADWLQLRQQARAARRCGSEGAGRASLIF